MASISGLSSGLDTATIITQLMQLEAAPQTRLKSRVGTEQSTITTLQSLNTKVALLTSKAETLAKPAAWDVVRSSSSNTAVAVTATPSAGRVSLSVTVTGVARTHQLGYADPAALTDVVTGASTKVRLDRFDGTPVDIETGDGTLQGLVTAINSSTDTNGLRASTVRTADGTYRLLVESAATGAAADFDLTALDGSALLGGTTVRAGTDASLDFGVGVTATSSTNTFTDVVPGVTLTIGAGTAVGTASTISVERDTAAVSTSVKGLVDSLNTLLSDIDTQSAYNAATKTGGPLTGDATARNLRTALLEAVYPADGGSLASIGIQVTRKGILELDQKKFDAAFAADPVGVAERFTAVQNGFADRVAKAADGAGDPITGTLTTAIEGRRTGVQRLQTSIDDWDRRLELRRSALERQFTALETALNQMTSQSNWLGGQLAALPSASG